MKEEIKMLVERAEKFERDAKYDFEQGDNDLAMFHLEQAFQLLIKAKLLELKGYFEKTHSLRKLLEDLIKTGFKKIEIEKFLTTYRKVLRDLERAYISARYLYDEFFEDEVKNAFDALKKLKVLLWK